MNKELSIEDYKQRVNFLEKEIVFFKIKMEESSECSVTNPEKLYEFIKSINDLEYEKTELKTNLDKAITEIDSYNQETKIKVHQ